MNIKQKRIKACLVWLLLLGAGVMYRNLDVLAGQMNKAETVTEAATEATTGTTTEAPLKKVYKKPGTPKLTGRYSQKKVKLIWKKVKRAQTYTIYRKNKKGKYVRIGSTKKTAYADKKVTKGNYYTYKVVASYEAEGKPVKGKWSKACKVLADTINPKKKMIALTFDDGPGPYTNSIVKCLQKNNSSATFFVVGNRVNSYKSAVKTAYKAGCEIGNHSFDHSNLSKLPKQSVVSQMRDTDKRVKKITGKNTTVMRVPYGETGGYVKSAVGKPIILWSIDTLDWKTRNKDKTVSAVMDHVKDGDIVLMHDIHKETKEAALELIPKLKKKGYQLVTVSELAKYRGYKLKKGFVYRSLRKRVS